MVTSTWAAPTPRPPRSITPVIVAARVECYRQAICRRKVDERSLVDVAADPDGRIHDQAASVAAIHAPL